jgi:hypothetical protein
MIRNFGVLWLGILTGCSSVPMGESMDIPTWVEHPEKVYSPERYLAVVGTGSTREEAIRDGKKQLAEVFQTRVQTVTRVKSDSSLKQSTEGTQIGTSGQEISNEMTFESNVRIRGAEVKESITLQKSTYILLALDKLKARSGLLLEANQLKTKLDSLLNSLETEHQVNRWEQAGGDLERLKELSGEASVLGLGVVVETSGLEERFRRLETELRARNEKKVFMVRMLKGDEQFARMIETCIQDQGARVSSVEPNLEPLYQVLVSVVEHPEHLAVEGWVKTRYEITANIIDPKGRNYRITEQRSETARSREAGLEAVVPETSKKLCQKLWVRIGELK